MIALVLASQPCSYGAYFQLEPARVLKMTSDNHFQLFFG